MNIGDFSAQTGLSAYTLRYYEKIGLLTDIPRNASGHRDYSSRDREWVGFITRLKETGMPLSQILHYAKLREQGESTFAPRQALLEAHHKALSQRIQEELDHLEALKTKLEHYRQLSRPLT
ncbi:MerR family transcriptional regulator [Marinobacter fonticola]|uniref:MerR family transcriptional regulator n=1 Tax=Marinobacter fonticola TaxID=2603215 RepID=UPI0011E8924C|nr:MerR family transcriptional regulator [Marinobacter fonticola]